MGAILSKWFDENLVYFHIMRCDITTQNGVRPNNIAARVSTVIQQYAKNNFMNKVHFERVIHITDTDGAFIPIERIVEDGSSISPYYSTTEIRCNNRQTLIERNMQKQANLNKLSSLKKIWGNIPYQIYYMSCNLDHVLHNKLNTSNDEKEKDSLTFARRYKDDMEGFLRFISRSPFSVCVEYLQSWDHIKQDKRSLERYTNLGLCFKPIESEA